MPIVLKVTKSEDTYSSELVGEGQLDGVFQVDSTEVTENTILVEADAMGTPMSLELKVNENEIPTDLQVMINNNEKGAALMRIVEVIGQDKLERIDEDTIYFIIHTLNRLNINQLRNIILLKVLPLKV